MNANNAHSYSVYLRIPSTPPPSEAGQQSTILPSEARQELNERDLLVTPLPRRRFNLKRVCGRKSSKPRKQPPNAYNQHRFIILPISKQSASSVGNFPTSFIERG
uniref:Uncharacterized protein n=1 Tax=Plectus sambesii TaxID=2011161 RepID=A0A914VKB0_9BILA